MTNQDDHHDAVTTTGEDLPTPTLSNHEGNNESMAAGTTTPDTTEPIMKPRRIIRRRRAQQQKEPTIDPILLEQTLQASNLPKAYSFEIPKTVQRIHDLKASHIALQMPEGLLLYATVLSDVLRRLAPTLQQVSILGDVTYGACCIDDLGAQALGCQLLVHYGHSCLVPIQHTVLPCLYVFVEITLDVTHLVDCLELTIQEQQHQKRQVTDDQDDKMKTTIYLLGTIQFRHALQQAQELLQQRGYAGTEIPQAKPLSPGEVLGCTSPKLPMENAERSLVCFVADGRFHLESTLISNPHIPLMVRYDPYSKTMTTESYNHEQMKAIRYGAIQQAQSANVFGILVGTLGRQGNPAIVANLQQTLKQHGKRSFLMLVSEITPTKLALFGTKVDAWVQVACPRLSVDWGHNLSSTTPVLNPYELLVCLRQTEWKSVYPMDYYAHAGGPWSNYHEQTKHRQFTKT